MEVADESVNAGEVVGVKGGRVRRSSGIYWWMCVRMIFREERESPKFGAGGVSPAFE